MADGLFLSCTDDARIMPSLDPDFDLEESVLAYSEMGFPLAWLLLYRPDHLIAQTFRHGGKQITASAMVVPTPDMLANLTEGFDRLLALEKAVWESLTPHVQVFREYLERDASCGFLTVEWQDDERFGEDGRLRRDVLTLLRFFSGKDMAADSIRNAIKRVTGFDATGLIMTPDEIRHSHDVPDAALENLHGVLGTELYRSVPWED